MYFKGWINRKGGSIDWGVYTEQDTLVLDRIFIGEICGYKTLEAEQREINKPLLFGKFEFCFFSLCEPLATSYFWSFKHIYSVLPKNL